MATGIVVRVIADHINHKTTDPAVVVVDDASRFAISLLSGHIGGANELAITVSNIINGIPVITTATDVNHLPAIDIIAKKNNLIIENTNFIKTVNMGFLKKQKFFFHDPYNIIKSQIPEIFLEDYEKKNNNKTAIIVDYKIHDCSKNTLYLRPQMLSVGIGCNRGTPKDEIKIFLEQICQSQKISLLSIKNLATIDIKKDEKGIIELGTELNIPIIFYTKEELNSVVSIENPSVYAKKYTGARSVCEASAILASNQGALILAKKKTPNVTIAIAREKICSM
jgi:cobalt-precorrin 5A hydrolase